MFKTRDLFVIDFFVRLFSFDDEGKIFLYNKVEHKFVPKSIPTWGWIAAREKSAQIHRLDGRMNTTQYLQLLTGMFRNRSNSQTDVRFVHDHHPVHSARIAPQTACEITNGSPGAFWSQGPPQTHPPYFVFLERKKRNEILFKDHFHLF